MGNYTTGIKTKDKILCSAKRLFFHKGVSAASLQEITREAGVRQSLLFYYFKDKDELCAEIHTQFSETLDVALCEEIQRRKLVMSKTVERCLFVAVLYQVCLSIPNIARFIAEINEGDIQFHSAFVQKRYDMLIEENFECLRRTTREFIIIENTSLNTLLFHLYMQGDLNNDKETLIRFKVRKILRSLYLDDEKSAQIEEEVLHYQKQFLFTVNDQFEVSLLS